MTIGIVVAIEMSPFEKSTRKLTRIKDCPAGFELYYQKRGPHNTYIVKTGMGEIAAASGTQLLIDRYKVDFILNFGVVGGLEEEMKLHRLCVVEKVVHYQYDITQLYDVELGQVDGQNSIFLGTNTKLIEKALEVCPKLTKVTCCSGDKFVGNPEEKKYLHDRFKGNICDMESAGIALTCIANRVPCLLLKAVSDSLYDGQSVFFDLVGKAGEEVFEICEKVVDLLEK